MRRIFAAEPLKLGYNHSNVLVDHWVYHLIGTAALGTSAQLGLVNTRPFRWLHHALIGLGGYGVALVWALAG